VRTIFSMNNKELAAYGIWGTGFCPRKSAPDMPQARVINIAYILAFTSSGMTSGAVFICEIAALNHKVFYNPVKRNIVVLTLLSKLNKILCRHPYKLWKQAKFHLPLVRGNNGYGFAALRLIGLVEISHGENLEK